MTASAGGTTPRQDVEDMLSDLETVGEIVEYLALDGQCSMPCFIFLARQTATLAREAAELLVRCKA
jgi:hypothetical protein